MFDACSVIFLSCWGIRIFFNIIPAGNVEFFVDGSCCVVLFAESPVVFAERMSVLKEIIKMKKLLWKKKGGEKSVLKKKGKEN